MTTAKRAQHILIHAAAMLWARARATSEPPGGPLEVDHARLKMYALTVGATLQQFQWHGRHCPRCREISNSEWSRHK